MIEAFFSLLQVWLTATTIVWHLLGCYHFCSVGVLFSFALTDFVELFFSSSSLPYDLMGCNYPSALKMLYGLKVCEAFLSFAIEREILEKSENQWGRGKIWMTKKYENQWRRKKLFYFFFTLLVIFGCWQGEIIHSKPPHLSYVILPNE